MAGTVLHAHPLKSEEAKGLRRQQGNKPGHPWAGSCKAEPRSVHASPPEYPSIHPSLPGEGEEGAALVILPSAAAGCGSGRAVGSRTPPGAVVPAGSPSEAALLRAQEM